MNPTSTFMTFWSLFGPLAFKVLLVVTLTELVLIFVSSAGWRRTVWQICALGLAALICLEVIGIPYSVGSWVQNRKLATSLAAPEIGSTGAKPDANTAESQWELSDMFREKVLKRLLGNQAIATAPSPQLADRPPESIRGAPPLATLARAPVKDFEQRAKGFVEEWESLSLETPGAFWPGFAWIVGTAIVSIWFILGRICFRLVSGKRRGVSDPRLHERTGKLAGRLQFRRPVRLLEIARLSSPIAFGVLRPTIGIPQNFARDFSPEEQEAVLAHELGHLASHDSAWQVVTDLVAATLWWHPLVWWARRRWQAATEAAADEASLILADGPRTLAECLVKLGEQLTQPRGLGWTGVAGSRFRSGLGQRVDRLIHLGARSWTPPRRWPGALAKTIGPTTMAVVVTFSTAWASPETFNKGETMKTLQKTWKHTLIALALVTSSAANDQPATTKEAPPAEATPAAQPAPTKQPVTTAAPAAQTNFFWKMDPKLAERYGLARSNSYWMEMDPKLLERYGLLRPGVRYSVQSAGFAQSSESNAVLFKMDPKMMERYGLTRPGVQLGAPPTGAAQLIAAKEPADRLSEQRSRIESKLEQIVLTDILYDSIPLSEVVKDLIEQARKISPPGVNFIVNSQVDVPLQSIPQFGGVDPVTGQRLPTPLARPVDLNNVVIRINPAIRNVRLKDVLNVITKVADHPIKYSVEEYGVVISPDPTRSQNFAPLTVNGLPDSPPLRVRTFRVDTNNFLAGLEHAFGLRFDAGMAISKASPAPVPVQPLVKSAVELVALISKASPAPVPVQRAPDSREIQNLLGRLLVQLGIKMDAPNKSIFYNDLTGVLMVRATAEDIEVVQAAIETLGGRALSRLGRVYVGEVPSEDARGLDAAPAKRDAPK